MAEAMKGVTKVCLFCSFFSLYLFLVSHLDLIHYSPFSCDRVWSGYEINEQANEFAGFAEDYDGF
jgi:hypothetical protein